MMKKFKLQLILVLATGLILLSSCSKFYQVLETSSNTAKAEKDDYAFENSDLKVNYNFWSDGGQISFTITNKTDSSLYIDWNKSHLIYNGISYEYWNDTEQSNTFYNFVSSTSTASFGAVLSSILNTSAATVSTSKSNKSVSVETSKFKPKRIIHLPPKSSIIVSEFSISKSPFYNCDINLKYKTPYSKSFSKDDSPLIFRNYLTYSKAESFRKSNAIDNEFYISSVTFLKEKMFLGKPSWIYGCNLKGAKTSVKTSEFPYRKPGSFYIFLNKK